MVHTKILHTLAPHESGWRNCGDYRFRHARIDGIATTDLADIPYSYVSVRLILSTT